MPTSVAADACPKCHSVYIRSEPACRVCGDRRESLVRPSSSSPKHPALIASLVTVIAFAAFIIYNWFQINRCVAYQQSVQEALASEEVHSLLGSRIQPGVPLGHVSSFGGSDFAEWSVSLSGSHGSGHLYGVANRVGSAWEFSRLAFFPAQETSPIYLTRVRSMKLPPAPSRKVYLVPLSLNSDEPLDWASSYYKAKLGIDVSVLPQPKLDLEVANQGGNQLDADRCLDFLERQYSNLVQDPNNILVGITSRDMRIPSLGWSFGENLRSEGRFAILSSSRLRLSAPLKWLNPEWSSSRLQKLLTKNLLIMYYGLPMSSDYTSVLSGGRLSGWEVDRMSGSIIGGEGEWDPFIQPGEPDISILEGPGSLQTYFWDNAQAPTSPHLETFTAGMVSGLMIERKTDFLFSDEPTMQFARVYRNLDDRSRAFGTGGSHSFDIFLGGQMGVAVDLILEDGSRIHFDHEPPKVGQTGDVYGYVRGDLGTHFLNAKAIFSGSTWQVETRDGWKYYFPYRPHALPQYVTVLTSFSDPSGRRYEMERDSFGALISITSPSGNWLHFENDSEHRIHRITSSLGRSVQYDYDGHGGLARVADSDGYVETYTYDERAQLLSAAHGDEKPFLFNQYFPDGTIQSQTLGDGRSFKYFPIYAGRTLQETLITDPNGLETRVQYEGSDYRQWLPTVIPH
jgi:YD repeat-containing protein